MGANRSRIVDHRGVFGDRLDDRNDVDFLQAQLPQTAVSLQVGAFDLTRDEHDWRRIDPSAGQPGQAVRAAGTRGDERHAQSAGHFRECFGADGAGVLMIIGDKLQIRSSSQGIVEVHGAAAGNHENVARSRPGKPIDDIIREFHAWFKVL